MHIKDNGKYGEMNYFMDWTDDELNDLGDLWIKYSYTTGSSHLAIDNEKDNYFINPSSQDFSSLSVAKTSFKPSTSWATAIIRLAERALNYRVQLSVDQVIQCVPQHEEIIEDGLRGVLPKSLSMYLMEVGLLARNDFTGNCEAIDSTKTYHFNSIYPVSPNAGGLMNFIAEDRLVFSMVAFDLTKIRFAKDMSTVTEPVKCSGYQPSAYVVITGYNYDKDDMTNSFWEVSSYYVHNE